MTRRLVCAHGIAVDNNVPVFHCARCEFYSARDGRNQTFLWLYPIDGNRSAIQLHPLHGEKPAPAPQQIDLAAILKFDLAAIDQSAFDAVMRGIRRRIANNYHGRS